MAAAVLRSHDPLKDRLNLSVFGSRLPPPQMKPPRRKPTRPVPPRSPPKPAVRSSPARHGRRVTFGDKENASSAGLVLKAPSRNLVMEEVTILRRGDDPRAPLAPGCRLNSAEATDEVPPFFSTNRMGPDPEILPKQIGFSGKRPVYAGPGFVTSPSPSALPFPALFMKKSASGDNAVRSDVATKNLRCLLRLEGLP